MRKLKQLMQIISQISPFKPNYSDLARDISVNRGDLKDYLFYMEKSGMIQSLVSSEKGLNLLSKVEKIYLDNTNLMTALSNEATNIGNMRETFFSNQLKVKNQVTSSPASDFLVNNKYTFEIGGRKKGKKQIILEINENKIVLENPSIQPHNEYVYRGPKDIMYFYYTMSIYEDINHYYSRMTPEEKKST